MESGLKHENKFTWPFVPRKHRIRYHLNMMVSLLFFFIPLIVIVMDFTSYISLTKFGIEYNFPGFSTDFFIELVSGIVVIYMAMPLTVITLVFIDKYLKFAITDKGIYKFKLLKTRFANEDIFFPWDKIKDIRVRKSAFCWFAWKWTVVVNLRMGIMGDLISLNGMKIGDLISLNGFKIGLNDERLQEFLGVIQQCAPESIWQKTQESYNKNK